MLSTLREETGLERQLDELLAESISHARERELQWLRAERKPIVIFGTGRIGKKLLRGLRQKGIEPEIFVDYNPDNWGTTIDGLAVVSPADAAAEWGATAQFVMTIWATIKTNLMPKFFAQLESLGCKDVVSFHQIFWALPDFFLPHYALDAPHCLLEQKSRIKAAYRLIHDEASRAEFVSQVRARLNFDFTQLAEPVRHPHYFPHDLRKLSDHETFVDCGAFNGDTFDVFLTQTKQQFTKYVAFEPDLLNYQALRENCHVKHGYSETQVRAYHAAVGEKPGKVRIASQGSPSTAIGLGDAEVDVIALDDVLQNDEPTVIKMDIEGSEIDALRGAAKTIARCRPTLAISTYHLQDHLWSIPLLMNELHPGYSLYLRPHEYQGWELVWYAIPESAS